MPPHPPADGRPAPAPARSTLLPNYQRDWPEYFDAVEGKPPRDTLLKALDRFDQESPAASPPDRPERLALDVACGSGRDTLAMLARTRCRWRVWAVDAEQEGLRRLQSRLGDAERPRVQLVRAEMESLPTLPGLPPELDLVNASFALPFCRPEAFPALWSFVMGRLRPGGRFAGQFFGERDEWAGVRPASHHTRESVVSRLLAGMVIEHLEEVDREGDDATGHLKHHHLFHVVARKR
jgi:tellurite methyltransferase